jgi:hypothetical protein
VSALSNFETAPSPRRERDDFHGGRSPSSHFLPVCQIGLGKGKDYIIMKGRQAKGVLCSKEKGWSRKTRVNSGKYGRQGKTVAWISRGRVRL